ncbi:putative Zn finger protein [Kineococcus radiotolerans]|uniref:Putative Zn finger protein n=1 Tax=Kineococcus radiotolerans TaxID=131568 RepID=A0A7W4TJY7_KINRA|nr:SWIM zinc finger family protein [Kineococcus radiotolerans]MBB2900305.1 putative Zn finger protein [Kineococcus radiotolerans]
MDSSYGRRRAGGGPKLRSQRGRIAQTWWSQRFTGALERTGDAGRLARGRTYARAGQVVELHPRPGAVGARVQGSRPRPYLVEILVRRWSPAEVEAVVAVVVENPLLLAPLFEGDVPPGLVDLLSSTGVELLPEDAEVDYDCSCPDDGEPCKHAAAVVYALAERLDAEPATALTLRGVELPDLLRRITTAASGPSAPVEDLTRHTADFHRMAGPLPDLGVPERVPGRTVADDLDDLVLGPGAAGLADVLRPYYVALASARVPARPRGGSSRR